LKVYILDKPGESMEQMLLWLGEEIRFNEIKAFNDYAQFVRQVGKMLPDLCIIRLGEVEMPGLKVARMIQQIKSDIRIIFLSDDSDYALEAYEIGANGYLMCPLLEEKFKKCIREIRIPLTTAK